MSKMEIKGDDGHWYLQHVETEGGTDVATGSSRYCILMKRPLDVRLLQMHRDARARSRANLPHRLELSGVY